MTQVLKPHIKAGPGEQKEPRLIGDILKEFLERSNEPLYAAYRKRNEDVKQSNAERYGKE